MKIIFLSLLLITLCFTNIYAISECRFDSIEAKVSAFFPSAHVTRQIFSTVMPYYEFEIAHLFCNNWQLWLNAGYLTDKGHAIGSQNKTTIQLVPLTFGLKYFYPFKSSWDFYAGAGIVCSFLKDKDYSPFVHKNISQKTAGGIAKLGFMYQCNTSFFIDFFTEYIYQKFSFHCIYPEHFTVRNNFNMSGLKIGGGIGFDF